MVNCFVLDFGLKLFITGVSAPGHSVYFVIYCCGGHILGLAALLVLGHHFCTWAVGDFPLSLVSIFPTSLTCVFLGVSLILLLTDLP